MQAELSRISDARIPRIADVRLRHVHDYWQLKRGTRGFPCRAEIQPAELKSVLPFLFIVDVSAFAAYRFRLVGTALVGLHGVDHTGRLVSEAFEPMIARDLEDSFDAVVRQGEPRLWHGVLDWHRGAERIRAEAVHLPLSSDGTAIDRIFGALVYGPKADRAAAGAARR